MAFLCPSGAFGGYARSFQHVKAADSLPPGSVVAPRAELIEGGVAEARGLGNLELISEMAQQDANASEVDEAEEVLGVVFPAGGEAAVAEEPREEALDLPAPIVAAQGPAILGLGPLAGAPMGSDQLDPSFFLKALVERIAVISSVSNKAIGCVLEKAGIDRLLDERDLMG